MASPADIRSQDSSLKGAEAVTRPRYQFWCWESIDRHQGTVYLRRLRVVSCPWFGIYIHWFYASDDDSLHDHPWSFLTFILRGGYWEHTPGPKGSVLKRWHAPWTVRWCPAHWLHRVEIDPNHRPVTLVFRGGQIRRWGFQTHTGWVPWPEYKGRR